MTKPRKPPIPMTWQQTGMKPGVKVPGTTSWMEEWKDNPENQKRMAAFARQVEEQVKTMSSMEVSKTLKLYLSGNWSSEDEVKIAAAIRRNPVWETRYNQMMEEVMKEEKVKKTAKSRERAAKTSLAERIGQVEDEVEALREDLHLVMKQIGALQRAPVEKEEDKPRKKKGKASKEQPRKEDDDIKDLLEALELAKEKGEPEKARKIRIKLRKLGYSLRSKNSK